MIAPTDKFDSERPDFKPYGLSCVSWIPAPMLRPDHHNEIEVNFVVRGRVTYLLAGARVDIDEGHLAVFWAFLPHQVVAVEADTRYFVATIPLASFLEFKLPAPFTSTLLRGGVLLEDNRHRAGIETQRFADWETDLGSAGKETQGIVLLELHARLRRMALSLDSPSAADNRLKSRVVPLADGSLSKVEQIVCLIAQRYLEPLNAETIGRAVGIHPNYAMNLFRKTFGTTIVEYLTTHRISHAQRLLLTTDLKVLDVALASGFQTLSRFNEAFRHTCGVSPKEFRKRQKL